MRVELSKLCTVICGRWTCPRHAKDMLVASVQRYRALVCYDVASNVSTVLAWNHRLRGSLGPHKLGGKRVPSGPRATRQLQHGSIIFVWAAWYPPSSRASSFELWLVHKLQLAALVPSPPLRLIPFHQRTSPPIGFYCWFNQIPFKTLRTVFSRTKCFLFSFVLALGESKSQIFVCLLIEESNYTAKKRIIS